MTTKTDTTTRTESSLWTTRPRFGPAGGPLEVVLTDEGEARAFSAGAGVRRGPASNALEALYDAGGEGYLTKGTGSRLSLTALGRYDQVAWGHLRVLGYVESIPPEGVHGDGVRLTEKGREACVAGYDERFALLERCRRMG